MPDNPQTTDSSSAKRHGWRFAVVLAGILAMVIAINHFLGQATTEVRGAGSTDWLGKVNADNGVTLELEPGDAEANREIIVPASHEISVLDAMKLAAAADPAWHFVFDGSGEKAFLTRIGAQTNEGATGRYWQYEVNGERANVSFGVQKVEPGDRVLWKFAPSE